MKQKIEEAVDMFLRDRWCDNDESYEYKLDSIYSIKISGEICNPQTHKVPHVKIQFFQIIDGLKHKLTNRMLFPELFLSDIDVRQTIIDGLYGQYQRLEKMAEDIEVSVTMYRSALEDNDNLRKEILSLKEDIKTWKAKADTAESAFQKSIKEYDEVFNKYQEEKTTHTKNMCRVVFAMHILSGHRDDKAEDFKSEYEKEIENLIKQNGNLEREISNLQNAILHWQALYNFNNNK